MPANDAASQKELRTLCIKLLIAMAYDFGLPSLNITQDTNNNNEAEQVLAVNNTNNRLEVRMDRLELVRRWENMAHPYIIFNSDAQTFTFIGIYLNRTNYKFINPNTDQPLEGDFISFSPLVRIELLKNRQPIYDNFNSFPRTKKINTLRIVMGLNARELLNHDPDKSYELTVDNCLKLLAIYLRLRCGNPVVIMGETGCGKTRKIKFFSDLHVPARLRENKQFRHLIHFKIHGGITADDIEAKVREAERQSCVNKNKMLDCQIGVGENQLASAILFFDEANTTESIGLIKEIMCDRTCRGRPVVFSHGLKIIAAVNPYRRHTDEMVRKLEDAGLGFYIASRDSKERLGHIPMRQLVYRVQPLPAALLPLVWDFGQLSADVEEVYIRQMLTKWQSSLIDQCAYRTELNNESRCMLEMLKSTQEFMRTKRDECSFVSLRDIERVLVVTSWFMSKNEILFEKMTKRQLENELEVNYQASLKPVMRAFVLALAVCYHASLYNSETRREFRQLIASKINLPQVESLDWVESEILKCQHVFLDEISLSENIARNHALLENVFMIIVCLELRIPLFIVGKPGSSKSLAKSIVERSMIGVNSSSELFRNLKESYFVNFQCSPLTQADMIKEAFREAALFQKDKDLNRSVAVVNLDEIGLAEGSESMPLKTLHPLLEDGIVDDTNDNKLTNSTNQNNNHKKVKLFIFPLAA